MTFLHLRLTIFLHFKREKSRAEFRSGVFLSGAVILPRIRISAKWDIQYKKRYIDPKISKTKKNIAIHVWISVFIGAPTNLSILPNYLQNFSFRENLGGIVTNSLLTAYWSRD